MIVLFCDVFHLLSPSPQPPPITPPPTLSSPPFTPLSQPSPPLPPPLPLISSLFSTPQSLLLLTACIFLLTSMLPFSPPLPPPCHPPSPTLLLIPLLHLPLSSPAPVHPAVLPPQSASTPQSVSPFIPFHPLISPPLLPIFASSFRVSSSRCVDELELHRIRYSSSPSSSYSSSSSFFSLTCFTERSLSLVRFSLTVCAGIKGLEIRPTYTKRSTHTERDVFVSLVLAPVDTGVFIKW